MRREKLIKIGFACGHLSTGGMPSLVLSLLRHLDRTKFEPVVFEGSYAGVDKIRNKIGEIAEIVPAYDRETFQREVTNRKINLLFYHDWDKKLWFDYPAVTWVHYPYPDPASLIPSRIYIVNNLVQNAILYRAGLDVRCTGAPVEIQTDRQFDRPRRNRIVYVATVQPKKCHLELIRALELFGDPDWEVVFVGVLADNFADYWRPLVTNYGDRFTFTGEVDDPLEYIADADVVVSASIEESFGLSIFEAAAIGKPLVLRDMPTFRLFWQDGETALIRPIGQPFVDAIRQVLTDDDLWNKLSKNGRRVAEQFSADKITRKVELILEEALRMERRFEDVVFQLTYAEGGVKIYAVGNDGHKIGLKVYDADELLYGDEIDLGTGVTVWIHALGRHWFVPYRSEVYVDGELAYEETLSLEGKTVLVECSSCALGDNLAWFPVVKHFQEKNKCKVLYITKFADLFKPFETDHFKIERDKDKLVLFNLRFDLNVYTPDRYKRQTTAINLQEIAGDILGVEIPETGLHVDMTPLAGEPVVDQPYICIAPHSYSPLKEWSYEGGWQTVVDWLNDRGYKVVWISKEPCTLDNVIDHSGDRDLRERITDLTHAEFHIGLSSGLSWLAWLCNTHVFLINPYVPDYIELRTNVTHIYNKNVCHWCFPTREYWYRCDNPDYMLCSKSITPDMVISAIQKWIAERDGSSVVASQTSIHERMAQLAYPRLLEEQNVKSAFTPIRRRVLIPDIVEGKVKIDGREYEKSFINTSLWVESDMPLDQIDTSELRINVTDIDTDWVRGGYVRGDWHGLPETDIGDALKYFDLPETDPMSALAPQMTRLDRLYLMKFLFWSGASRILELGSGKCGTACILAKHWFTVRTVDIENRRNELDQWKRRLFADRDEQLEQWQRHLNQFKNIEFVQDDLLINWGKHVDEFKPDTAIIDFNHNGATTMEVFIGLTEREHVKRVLIHDVNSEPGERMACEHIIRSDKYREWDMLKSPFPEGYLFCKR